MCSYEALQFRVQAKEQLEGLTKYLESPKDLMHVLGFQPPFDDGEGSFLRYEWSFD